MLSATARFRCDPAAVREARRWTANVLSMWRISHTTIEDVVLLMGELATNAVRHAHSEFVVAVSMSDQLLRGSVADDSPDMPTLRPPSITAVDGRGLQLVRSLSAAWGVEKDQGESGSGKAVWFELLASLIDTASRSGD